jgi:hypothetical protein
MYTWIDLKINGVWWGSLPVDGTTPFPVIWEVDYVRWYSQGGSSSINGPGLGRALPNPVPSPDYPPEFRFLNAHCSRQGGNGGDPITLSLDVVSPVDRKAITIATEHKSWIYNWEMIGVAGVPRDFKANVWQTVTFNEVLGGNLGTKDWDKVCVFAGQRIDVLWVLGIGMPAGRGGEALIPGGGYCGDGALTGGVSPPPPLLDAKISVGVKESGLEVEVPPAPAGAQDPSVPQPTPTPPLDILLQRPMKDWATTLASIEAGVLALKENVTARSPRATPVGTAAPLPPPAIINASRSGVGPVTTAAATATAVNETPPYTYNWVRRAGYSQAIKADSPSSATTTFSANLSSLGPVVDVFDVYVLDAQNHAVQETVTVQITAVSPTSAPWSRQLRMPRLR